MANFNLWQFPPPSYKLAQTFFNTQDDFPGPRCGHTLTAVFHRLVLFGGITAVGDGGSEISFENVTNAVHCFNVFTSKWTRVYPDGEPPSPRAGHAAVSKGTLLLIQGGMGPSSLCAEDLHILDMTSDTFRWQKVLVQEGVTPGPRYGHVMGLAGNNIVMFGGKRGDELLADTLVLDTTQTPNAWKQLNPYGDAPSGRMYASASTRDNRYFMLCGGRDFSGRPMRDVYSLEPIRCGWMWTRGPGLDPSHRYQHTAVFVNPRLHVIGGALSDTSLVDAEAAVSVLDTSTGVWVDTRDGPGISKRDNNGIYFNQVMRRCLHAAASVGSRIYVYGGFREGALLGDLIVSEDDKPQNSSYGPATPTFMGTSSSAISLNRFQEAPRQPETNMNYSYTPQFFRQKSIQDLVNKVISVLLRPQTWEPPVDRKFFLSYPEVIELCIAAKQIIMKEPTVLQLNVPIKVFGDLHGQFGDLMRLFHEYGFPSRTGDISYIDYLFLGDYVDRGKHSLETLVLLLALKIEYPNNIHLIRGNHESKTMNAIHGFLHECTERLGSKDGEYAFILINELFNHLPLAALIEKKIFCMHGGIGSSVISVEQVANIKRPVLVDCEDESRVVKDLLWSDPTANDSILGIGRNSRGNAIVTFGPDRVKAFCEENNLELIIRGHECVLDGFERFAQGQLITVFSATNYCGSMKNAGAILVIGRDLDIVAKLIHPLPPPISPSESFVDKAWMEVDSERPPTPVRGRPKPDIGQDSTL